jgi:hypothetical protein
MIGPDPHRRNERFLPANVTAAVALAAALGIGGCSSTADPATGDLRLDLHHRDPRVRIDAAVGAAEAGRLDLVPDLIADLGDRDEAVRFFAGIALKRMTGQDFGYLPYADLAARADAAARWSRWLDLERGPDPGMPAGGTTTLGAATPVTPPVPGAP